MLHLTLRSATVIGLIGCAASLRAETASEQLKSATIVLVEILSSSDKGIPKDLLDKAYCVVVVPGVKQVAFGAGASTAGDSYLAVTWPTIRVGRTRSCSNGGWQSGISNWASEMDIDMLVMNESGKRRLLQSKFTLGAKAGSGGGPSRTNGICRDRHTIDSRNSILVPISRSVCRSIGRRGNTAR
jgi:SH3 domain-containing YSC84-like protein 1